MKAPKIILSIAILFLAQTLTNGQVYYFNIVQLQKTYILDTSPTNFFAARTFCEQNGASLVKPGSKWERDILLAIIRPSYNVWLGVRTHFATTPTRFDNGEQIRNIEWSRGHPRWEGGCVSMVMTPGGTYQTIACHKVADFLKFVFREQLPLVLCEEPMRH